MGLLLGVCTLAACSGDQLTTGPGAASRTVTLSFTTSNNTADVTGPAAAQRVPTPLADIIVTSNQDTLVITKAQVVLSRLELTSGMGEECDDESANSTCQEIKRSFVLVDLPTDTGVHPLIAAQIPPGSYSSLEAKIRVPHADSDTNAMSFLAAHPEFAGANVRVEGTFRGVPFVYTGAVNTRLELAFSPPVVVDSTGLNITIRVDLATWFRDGTGALIDPTTANAGGTNATFVADNIRRSFHAFRDDERDGQDDGNEGSNESGESGETD